MIINPFRYYWPPSLFAAGEQGAWYDPAEFSTLFQDSAGTTPVTAVEQAVGLMLDKSKGLVLGSERSSGVYGSGWSSADARWTYSSNSVSWAGGGGTNVTTSKAWVSSILINTFVKFQFTITGYSGSGNCGPDSVLSRVPNDVASANTIDTRVTADGTYTFYGYFRGGGGSGTDMPCLGRGTNSFTISNISVRELPGNHAYQSTSTSRPTLRARYNLLTYSEQFDNAAWTKNSLAVTQNTVVSPNGETTADTITLAAATGGKNINHAVSAPALSRFSIYAKAGSHNFIQVFATGDAGYVNVNLSTGTFTASGATGTVTSAGNGWYHITVTFSAALTGAYIGAVNSTAAVRAESWTASGTETFYIWGADLRVANDGVGIPAYQRIAAATDYDTAGFPVYLDFCESFGGTNTDNSMLTNSIDFSGTDKMTVFAGVRKLSDAARAIVVELGNASTGRIQIEAPSGTSANDFVYYAGGSLISFASGVSLASPITRVIVGQNDIAADTLAIWLNGVLANSSSSDQGTGAAANLPLYIGRRNNASLPFTGRLYSLIVRGATTSDAQIAAIETWVNSRARAY